MSEAVRSGRVGSETRQCELQDVFQDHWGFTKEANLHRSRADPMVDTRDMRDHEIQSIVETVIHMHAKLH